MTSFDSLMAELESKGSEKMRAMYARHGMTGGTVFGVSIADLKVFAKSIKGQQDLACQLLETGNLDAMYLGGMVANGSRLSREQLNELVRRAAGMQMISEYTVSWMAVESPFGRELALEWIPSDVEHIAASGWCTYADLLATKPDEALDLKEIEGLLQVIASEIDGAQNRVRHTMNNFVISVGTYVKPLVPLAKETAAQIGKVSVDMGDTACKVPSAIDYIAKVEAMGRTGVKRKSLKC